MKLFQAQFQQMQTWKNKLLEINQYYKNSNKSDKSDNNDDTHIIFDNKGTNAIEWGAYGVPESFLINNNKIIKKYSNHKGRKGYEMSDKRFLNSFDLIILMMENKDLFFEKINAGNINIYDEVYLRKLNDNLFESLEYTKDDYNLIEKKEPKNNRGIEYQLAYFDFETNPYTDVDGKIKVEKANVDLGKLKKYSVSDSRKKWWHQRITDIYNLGSL